MAANIEAGASQDEATPEQRLAHHKAFEEAVAALEEELRGGRVAGQAVAVLTAVRDEFAAWDDGLVDGPMPPPATLEGLRAQFQYVPVDAAVWKQVPDYQRRVHQIFDGHDGGGTSMSYKLFALFRKGLSAVRAQLRSGSGERALCEAIALTKAMKDNDEWYGDTDAPEEAASIVKALGNLWSAILAAPRGPHGGEASLGTLTSWLEAVRREWEGEASEQLGAQLAFAFPAAAPPTTPTKRRGAQGQSSGATEPASGAKRKASSRGPAGRPAKAPRTSESTQAWLHQLDSELARRQASAVQLRCEAGGTKRAIVVSGAYPLKAIGATLAEAFGRAVCDFDPHPNKGKSPPGLHFTIQRDGGDQALESTLKIVQAVQNTGDTICAHMQDLVVSVTLDAIKFKGDDGFDRVKAKPMPRCVGGDAGLKLQMLKRLNRTFFHDRQPICYLGCSRKQAVSATLDAMARPIALRPGVPVVEGRRARGGEVPPEELRPLVF